MTDFPLGGSTGLSHEHSTAIEEAARWIAAEHPRGRGLIPMIRERFGLSPTESIEALSLARKIERDAA